MILRVFVVLGLLGGPLACAEGIEPVLEKRCRTCHGASVQMSKLSLVSREAALKGGARGVDLVPGDAAASRLYRMAAGLEEPRMPMGGSALSAEEIEALRVWINQGAKWDGAPVRTDERDYWAFRLPVRPAGNSIDAFITSALEKNGLKRGPRADRVTLLRRAYLDLLGLPPTPEEAAEFLNDQSPDAWAKLVDRLLASPHYGERWGRHWLDVARYADSNGFEHDFDRPNAWRYRDYVIRSFNEDKPYDQFLREQIAGDEIAHVTNDSLIATGFLRSYAKVGFREKDNPEFRYEYLDDQIATIGRGVLGLTVQCARCHDHKFDPIKQADYYRLQASLWGYVEVDQPLTSREVANAWRQKNAEVDSRVAELKAQLRELLKPYKDQLLPAKYKKFPQNVQDAIATPEEKRTPGQALLAGQVIRTVDVSDAEVNRVISGADKAEKQRIEAAIRGAEKERPAAIPMAMAVTDGDYRFTPDGPGDEPAPGKGKKTDVGAGSYLHAGSDAYQVPPSYFLIRGDVNSRGPETQPGFVNVITYGNPPTVLTPSTPHTSGRRLALAEWIVSRDNPMTARVAVNRIWQHHFGVGIVPTLDNFGKMGEAPSNPELLDWLATEFMDGGWSVKQINRTIMMSEAYQMASEVPENLLNAGMARDPENKLLWRYRLQRLDAESIRDSILVASGGLNRQMGGPPVFPVIPDEILKSMTNGIWKQTKEGPEVWRRSVYIYRKRGLPMPLLDVFDLPNQNISCGARNVTTVPTQALALMNNDFVLGQAGLFAQRIEEAAPGDRAKQVERAYAIALSRAPTAEEKRLGEEFLKSHGLADFADVLVNLNEFLYLR